MSYNTYEAFEALAEGHNISGSVVMMINAMIDKDFFFYSSVDREKIV